MDQEANTLRRPGWENAVVLVILALCAAALYLTSTRHGEFWWSDAPRHALNGVFIKDLIRDLPLADLQRYAIEYYLKYPALTILFYPPLLYVTMAPFFALLGVSHVTAMLVMTGYYFAFGVGSYALARRWLPVPLAAATAVLAMGTPEIALWGRQVMLEVPAAAFLVWSLFVFVRYLDRDRPAALYLSLFLLLCAIYTKLSLVFIPPVLGLVLLLRDGRGLFMQRRVWIGGAAFVIGLVPLLVLTVKFGQGNLQSVTGIEDSSAARDSIAGWVWYARQLPDQLSWPVTALAAGGAALIVLSAEVRRRIAYWPLLGLWFAIGYVFFSLIDLKEARHSVFLLWPAILAAILLFHHVLPRRLAVAAGWILAAATFAATLAWRPVPAVSGYAEAADFVSRAAPADSVVLFSGKRDGSFIFSMRAHEERRDLSVLRADKLLLRIAIRRTLGVEEKPLTSAEMLSQIGQAGVTYVVAQRDFWTDLEVMDRFQRLLEGDQFEEVGRIPVIANHPTEDRELRLYRYLGPVATGERRLRLELPTIGRELEGSIGGK